MQKIFDTIDSLYDDYVRIWEEICNIESPTAYKAGVDAVGKYCADFAEARGWQVEYFRHDVSGDVVCITMNPEAKGQPISLSAHMDTVHPVGCFGTPAVRVEGDKIYGPGVCDCKGGIVVALLAMDALQQCGFCDRPVQLLLQSDEEGGSRGSQKATINYMCQKASKSVAFINLEGYSVGKAIITRKGIITFTFKITGQEAHSSKCATDGANAIAEAAHKIIELEKIKDEKGLTCNCGVISGGTVPNTVAGYCEFQANVRFATAEQLEWIKEHVKKVADTVYVKGCKCEVEQYGFRVAMEYCERNVELLERINQIFDKTGLSRLEAAGGMGGSDAADVTVFGIPCIDDLGAIGGLIHNTGEYALLETLHDTPKRLAAIICNLE